MNRLIKSLSFLLSLFLFLIMTLQIRAEDTNDSKIVRVGYYEYENCMEGATAGAPKSGYVYEYLQKLAGINNWTYEYVYDDFGELYKMLENGEIDILPCLVYTEERAEKVDYSDLPILEETYYISGKDEDGLVTDFKSFEGKRIAVTKGAYQNTVLEQWLEKNNISMDYVYYDDFTITWKALDSEDVDYVLEVDSTAPIGYSKLVDIGGFNSFLGISKKRNDILNEANYGRSIIDSINPFQLEQMKDKYFAHSFANYGVKNFEREWLEERDEIRIGVIKSAEPYAVCDDNQGIIGVLPEILNKYFADEKIDKPIVWQYFDDTEQMREALEDGVIDASFPVYYDYYVAEGGQYRITEPIDDLSMGMLYKDSINGAIRTIAIIDSRLDYDYVKDHYPNVSTIRVKSVAEGLSLVMKGEADCIVANMIVLQRYSQDCPASMHYVSLNDTCEMCLATKYSDEPLISLFNKAINYTTAGEKDALVIKYSGMQDVRLTINQFIREHLILSFLAIIGLVLIIAIFVFQAILTTKQKKHIEELQKKQEEISKAKLEADSANAAKTRFLFNMSHDIRTPMNTIIGYTNLAMCNADDTAIVKDCIEKINVSSTSLLTIVNDILEMGRIEGGLVEIETKKCDIRKCCENVFTLITMLAREKNLKCDYHFHNLKHRTVLLDDKHFGQIIMNLLNNAVKYTPAGGMITLYAEEKSFDESAGCAMYEFAVVDNGIGISENSLEMIFELFSKEKTSTQSGQNGIGLGLAICKRLVALMGGRIWVESKLNVGSKFSFTLPLEICTQENEDGAANKARTLDVDTYGRILVVEDNDINREMLADILKMSGVANVEQAADGSVAVDMVNNHDVDYYDLILMDIQMPIMDGYEATKKIRTITSTRKNLPIIAVSANSFDEDKMHSYEAGMNGHIPKPFEMNELVKALEVYEERMQA